MPKAVEKPTYNIEFPAVQVVTIMLERVFEQRKINESHYKFFRKTFESRTYLEEHCTLRIGFPRQLGNSTAAVHAAKMLGIRKDRPGSGLVVAPYLEQCKILERYGAENLVSMGQIENRLKEDEENVLCSQASVVVDAASYIFNVGKVDLLYDLIDPDKGGWLVLIG